MSDAFPSYGRVLNTSGAAYDSEQQYVVQFNRLPLGTNFEKPKSVNLTVKC